MHNINLCPQFEAIPIGLVGHTCRECGHCCPGRHQGSPPQAEEESSGLKCCPQNCTSLCLPRKLALLFVAITWCYEATIPWKKSGNALPKLPYFLM